MRDVHLGKAHCTLHEAQRSSSPTSELPSPSTSTASLLPPSPMGLKSPGNVGIRANGSTRPILTLEIAGRFGKKLLSRGRRGWVEVGNSVNNKKFKLKK